MTTKDDGGPAAPVTFRAMTPNGMMSFDAHPGMTLRDWFAGQASEQDIEHHRGWEFNAERGTETYVYSREEGRYRYADAMLAERNK